MKLRKLLGEMILVRPDAVKDKDGEIHLPDMSVGQDDTASGLALDAGPGRKSIEGAVMPNAVSAGDRLLYLNHSGWVVKIEGEELRMILEADVLAILESEDDR